MVHAAIGIAVKTLLGGALSRDAFALGAGLSCAALPPLPGRDRIGRRPQSPAVGSRIDFGRCERRIIGVAKEVPSYPLRDQHPAHILVPDEDSGDQPVVPVINVPGLNANALSQDQAREPLGRNITPRLPLLGGVYAVQAYDRGVAILKDTHRIAIVDGNYRAAEWRGQGLARTT